MKLRNLCRTVPLAGALLLTSAAAYGQETPDAGPAPHASFAGVYDAYSQTAIGITGDVTVFDDHLEFSRGGRIALTFKGAWPARRLRTGDPYFLSADAGEVSVFRVAERTPAGVEGLCGGRLQWLAFTHDSGLLKLIAFDGSSLPVKTESELLEDKASLFGAGESGSVCGAYNYTPRQNP